MSAILFGSISSIADTSELQRKAFNDAFAQHGLSWTWEREDYRALLTGSGGAQRIADYAESVGETVDAAAVHATKSALFQQSLTDSGLAPRSGVAETIRAAHEAGEKVALVSGTSRDNITALLSALDAELGSSAFDLVLDSSSADAVKPDPALYVAALKSLDEQADKCVAIEDNLAGVEAATAAGVPVVAFPNENTAAHDFGATPRVGTVDFDELRLLTTASSGGTQ